MSGGSHSQNLGLLDQEASMQNIDRLVEALEMEAIESEMEARESGMSKRRKLFLDEPSSSALQVYHPLIERSHQVELFRIAPPSEVEVEFLKLTGRKYKKDVWQDIAS
ncbi:hypothetical protein R1flu_024692 [Riccia fluitans]|uniref:Uncharacterized protein n=1 Tax=Riccia fluitans TaxID=41844 RepID=A0ABD1XW15_9MARC